jgi:hypothetical protein
MGLILGTVWMVLVGFGALGIFTWLRVDLGHCVDGFRWFLGR